MARDLKKIEKRFFYPPAEPELIEIPDCRYLAIAGHGDPNEEDGAYAQALGKLYGIAYGMKMAKKKIQPDLDFVVPPLEGFWWQPGLKGVDLSRKHDFHWVALLRMPDHLTEEDLALAKEALAKKKKMAADEVHFLNYQEGLVIHLRHTGSYDSEVTSHQKMLAYAASHGYEPDFASRHHHEIYIKDPRRTPAEKLETVLRMPVRPLAP